MTSAEILAAIAADATLTAEATARNWAAIASTLSAGRTKVISRITTARGIAALYADGAVASEVVLLKLEGARDAMLSSTDAGVRVFGSMLRRQLGFLDSQGLDFGDATLRGQIDVLATQGALTAHEATLLKAIAEIPDPVTAVEVERAVGLQPVSTWTGAIAATEVRDGMVYVTITYSSSVQGVAPKTEQTWGVDLTPLAVEQMVSTRCSTLQKADAARALYGV
jgi:hypothetical protein